MTRYFRFGFSDIWSTIIITHIALFQPITRSNNIWVTLPHIQQELRFVEVINCIAPTSELAERWTQTLVPRQLLQCPSGAFVHIVEAVLGQTFSSDSPCLYSSHYNENSKFPVPDPTQRVKCTPTSITSVVQQLCQGMNTCDIVRKLTRMDVALECQQNAFLRVNYTCFPAYSQQEIICADSYVELSCSTFGIDASLLLLRAQFGSLSMEVSGMHSAKKNKHCPSSVDQADCKEMDVSGLVASTCNRRSVCTVNPAVIVDQIRIQREFPNRVGNKVNHSGVGLEEINHMVDPMACLKADLYLEYTCAHEKLLRQFDSPVPRSNSNGEKKKLSKSSHLAEQLTDRKLSTLLPNRGAEFHMDKNDVTRINIENEMKHMSNSNQLGSVHSEAVPDGSNVLVISLIPSVICVILVLVLIAYMAYTKRLSKGQQYERKELNSCYTGDKTPVTLLSHIESIGASHDSASTNSPVHATMDCSMQVADKGRFMVNLKDCHIPWNPLDSKGGDSSSVIGSVCCECSQTEGEQMINEPKFFQEITVKRSTGETHSHNSMPVETSIASRNFSNKTCASNWNPPSFERCHLCSIKPSPMVTSNNVYPIQKNNVGNTGSGGSGGGSDEGVGFFKPCENTSIYAPYPTQSKVIPSLSDTPRNWTRYAYAQLSNPSTTTRTTTTSHISSPVSPRSANNRTFVSGKQDLYQSIIRSNSQNNSQPNLKSMDPRSRTKVAPPLFQSTESFIRCANESNQPYHSFKMQLNRIPVVRYPHEADEDSEDNSQSTNDNNTNKIDGDLNSALQSNRPDLCPPIKIEGKLMSNLEVPSDESLPNVIQPISHNKDNYHVANSSSNPIPVNSLKSAGDQSSSPDYSFVGDFRQTTLNSSPRPHPGLLGNLPVYLESKESYPSPKMSKHLRFQSPVLELPCSVYDRKNLPPACDMPSSMCRSMQP